MSPGRVGAPVLRPVDRAAFVVALATRLRAHGVAVGLTAVDDAVRALTALPPVSRSRLYWAMRVAFVRRHEELAGFDAVFDAVFERAVLGVDPNARRAPSGAGAGPSDDGYAPVRGAAVAAEDGAGLPWATLPRDVRAAETTDGDGERPVLVPLRLPSGLAGRLDLPFADLDPGDMELLSRWLQDAVPGWPTRRSRRMVAARAYERVALRPTLAAARRTAWEPAQLLGHRRVDKPRPVVMLCDVSQSMQSHAVAYLHLMRALALGTDAEVFAFATSLTRLTPVLRHRSARIAVEQATQRVDDRFGGTRIATNVHALLASHHGGAVRGAVVIVASDGWDSDPPQALEAAMRRLRRRAYRVVWVNPRVAGEGFAPRVASMAAALPYCDRLLPGDTFGSLAAVVREVAACSRADGPSPRGLSSTA